MVALAIKLESKGPVFFRQRRVGKNLKVFRVYKFRTMSVMEDGGVVKQAERNDSRITRVGRLLRRTSMDELPQLINVLKGEMSIVGPRPHAVVHDDEFMRRLGHYSRRHRVKPGITGWAQVNGLRGETRTNEQLTRRMEHDLYYVANWSIWFDLEIMLRTFVILLRGRNAY
jgi:putative colanic acid biosynthesis UDP-glucose lipid carrier transferase